MIAKLTSAAALAALLATGSAAFAQQDDASNDRAYQMEHKFEKAQGYYQQCEHTESAEFDAIRPYIKAFTDVEVMTATMADPVKTAKLMQIVADPRTMHIMMKCSTEPVMWDTWMRGMTDLNKMFRAGLVFMNPMTYFNWMMAPFQPEIYASMLGMVSPDNLGRWGTALVNPTFYQPMYEPLVSLDWYTPRLAWMVDPVSYAPMLNLIGLGEQAQASAE